MKKAGKSRKKKILLILGAAALCAALVLVGLMLYGKAQMAKIPGLTFEDALQYTTQGKSDAKENHESRKFYEKMGGKADGEGIHRWGSREYAMISYLCQLDEHGM